MEDGGPLKCELVEIHGVSSKVLPSDYVDPTQTPKSEDAQGFQPIEVDGCCGRIDVWDPYEEVYAVELFNGYVVDIKPENLREYVPKDPLEGGFDVVFPRDQESAEQFAADVTEKIKEKGFCVIQTFLTEENRRAAVEDAHAKTLWHLPRQELLDAFMGFNNKSKYAGMPETDHGLADNTCLDDCDVIVLDLSKILLPICPNMGFEICARMSGIVRVDIPDDDDLNAQALDRTDYDSGRVYGHLEFLERRRLCMMYMLEHEGGEVVLYPEDQSKGSEIRIPLTLRRILIFRHDVMGYSYQPIGPNVLLQSWCLAPTPYDFENERVAVLPDELLGERVHVMSNTCRFPGSCHDKQGFWNVCTTGTDSQVYVPLARWDHEQYYTPNKGDHAGLTYTKHGAFADDDDLIMFDNQFFGIPFDEAELMSPSQRCVLELGFETMHLGGYTKETALNADCGVFLGDSGSEWDHLVSSRRKGPFASLGRSQWLTACRLSHIFGLRGPCQVVDTACSSSLVALNAAHCALRKHTPDQGMPNVNASVNTAVSIGCNLILGPSLYIKYAGATMLSPQGRCHTFNASADGFARGEGVAGVMVKASSGDEEVQKMLACLIGSAVNQDGRSASMTAPHGPSQQQCITASMEESALVPDQITVAECHGTGTALGDPIEVGALMRVMQDRDTPLLATSAKTVIGHLEACAGIAGVTRCIGLLNHSCAPPNVHLSEMNPHLDMGGFPVHFMTDTTDYGCESGIAGVSSFGFGGTNGRGDLWGRALAGHLRTDEVDTGRKAQMKEAHFSRMWKAVPSPPKIVFAFPGEGAHAQITDISVIRVSPAWPRCAQALSALGMDIEELFEASLGVHVAPGCIVVTTVINVCLCDLWKLWGYLPNMAFGHSSGEIAAAYAAGLFTLEQTMTAALRLGEIAARKTGAMLYTTMERSQFELLPDHDLVIASFNHNIGKPRSGCYEDQVVHVTLCGAEEAVDAYIDIGMGGVKMRPKNPWHHPDYADLVDNEEDAALLQSLSGTRDAATGDCRFVSSTAVVELDDIDGQHWATWLSAPVDFAAALEIVQDALGRSDMIVVELGAHSVLAAGLSQLGPLCYLQSMSRGQASNHFIMSQRAVLKDHLMQQEGLRKVLDGFEMAFDSEGADAAPKEIAFQETFEAQGLSPSMYPELVRELRPFFPGLEASDLELHTSLAALVANFGPKAAPDIGVRTNRAVMETPSIPGPQDSDELYLIGTWSGWQQTVKMKRVSSKGFEAHVQLGETLQEQFRVVVNEDPAKLIYPVDRAADQSATIYGPSHLGSDRSWLIDGRNCDARVYRVKFEWDFNWERGERKRISWEPVEKQLEAMAALTLRRRKYFVVASWTAWNPTMMKASEEEDDLVTSVVRIGVTGQEEFYIMVDRDTTQVIHPAIPKAMKTSIPVRGPDAEGKGKHWLVRGPQGDVVTISLRVSEGNISVSATSSTKGSKVWTNVQDADWCDYFITTSANQWDFEQMKVEASQEGVFMHDIRMGSTGKEEFQISVGKDPNKVLHPRGAKGGEDSPALGPDDRGKDLNWQIQGTPFAEYRVLLNMAGERPTVSWSRSR